MCCQQGNLASRKMAKKGGQASLQLEITNDDEWEAVLKKVGLVGKVREKERAAGHTISHA